MVTILVPDSCLSLLPELIISTVSSVVIFWALGGCCSSVLSSHLFHPGAFAVEHIPALWGQQSANSTDKTIIRNLGKRYGCHSCRKTCEDVCIHQPPSHLLRKNNSSSTMATSEGNASGLKVDIKLSGNANSVHNGVTERQFFYPRCYDCSSMQGGLLDNEISPK